MRAGVGYSDEESAEVAAAQATELALERAAVNRADLAVVFATTNYWAEYPRMLGTVRATSGARSPVGCSGMGVLTSDAVRARPFLVPTATSETLSSGQTIRRLIEPLPEGPRLLVLLPDPFSDPMPQLLIRQ